MQPSFKTRFPSLSRRAFCASAVFLFGLAAFLAEATQVILYQERFETDGEGTRWVSEGGGVSEDPASGPSFWGLNSLPSFVGVRANAPARRAGMVWHHNIPADAVSQDFLSLFDCVVNWLTTNRTARTVLFSPPAAGPGDEALANRLTARGFVILGDNTSQPPPPADTIALVIQSSSGVPDPTRFTSYPAPLLSYNASNHDDELISQIGVTTSIELGTIRMNTATNHPARGGKSNSFIAVSGTNTFDVIGINQPAGAVPVAFYDLVSPRTIATLADADAYISGTLESIQTTGTVTVADFAIGEGARYSGEPPYDQPVPGDPNTAGTFAVRATGQIQVMMPGTWTFALPVDDGARLRIDRNRNGFGPEDNIFNEEDGPGLRVLSNDVVFAEAGIYDFEWTTFTTGNNFAQEIAVAADPGGGTVVEPWDSFNFELLGQHSGESQLRLLGGITAVTYVPNSLLREPRPFLTVIDTGAALLGGPLTGFEGTGFWGGADLNDVDYGLPFNAEFMPKSLTLPIINVSGRTNVQLRLLVAGSDVDFEDPDFFRILADPDGDGPAEPVILAHFRQFPPGHPNRGALGDTNDNQRTVLRAQFKEVVYNIPAGATSLRLRFEAFSTFFNEVVAFDNVRITVPGAPAPTISVRRDGANVVVTYTGVLQSSATVRGTYTDVAGASSPLIIPPASQGSMRFYRSRNP